MSSESSTLHAVSMSYNGMQPAVIPTVINQLLVTSLVLSGATVALAISATYRADSAMSGYESAVVFLQGAIIANHISLYHISKGQGSSPSADMKAKCPSCLFGWANIIFTGIMALVLICVMWQAFAFGTWIVYTKPNDGTGLIHILEGTLGYVESVILITLFGMYIHKRRVHARFSQEVPHKV